MPDITPKEAAQKLNYILCLSQIRENDDYFQAVSYAVSILCRVASGELAEVKHGYWETNSDYPDTVICHKCGYKEDVWWADTGTHYCPSCGALMDGKDDNHETD